MITDCHVHIEPFEMLRAGALELMKKKRANFEDTAFFLIRRHPTSISKSAEFHRRRCCSTFRGLTRLLTKPCLATGSDLASLTSSKTWRNSKLCR